MNRPTFSIIVPTYARPTELTACLSSMARLDYPRECFEVIVVDDGSAVSPTDIISRFEPVLDIKLLRQPNAGPAKARNTGVSIAKYDYVAFTDDDCNPRSTWLTELSRQFDTTPNAIVGGPIVNALHDDAYATASQSLVSYLYEYYNCDPQHATFFTSNNFAMSRKLFIESGGFDTRYRRAAAEDREFCERWTNDGRQLVYAHDAIIDHAHHLTLRRYWRQHFHYGRGAFRFHQVRAARGQQPIRVEPMSFYWNLLSYPYQCGLTRASEIAILLWISQAANALGFFWEKYTASTVQENTPALDR